MTDDGRSPLQNLLADTVARRDNTRDHYDSLLRKKLETTGKPLWDIERGKVKKPSPRVLRAIEEVFDFRPDTLVDLVHPREGSPAPSPTPIRQAASHDDIDMVGIQHIDLDYGLGATFADGYVDVEVLQFPKVWVETITHAPPALLTWARGRGDSMEPTIKDGDLVLLDRSQRVIREPDALWAFAVGTTAAIKRLRLKGDRVLIFSDNPSVKPDEEMLADINIVGRVVFVGARK